MIRIALNHKSIYQYDQQVNLGPQLVRLRPAPHCRTPISSYSLKIKPVKHFINWQQDPHSNFNARLVFDQTTDRFEVEVDLIAEMTVINPFDFFLEDSASDFPFSYDPTVAKDLVPFLQITENGPRLLKWVDSVDLTPRRTIDFLVDLIQQLQSQIRYGIRLEPGVQTGEETLELTSGSCRDSAWLLVQILRHIGLAARFVSGYLIQLKPDVESLDGPSGASEDFTDLHAWTEVYLPGAGWVGMDATSGLFAGEGHIPLACTPDPTGAAPISGGVSQSECTFHHEMSITRIHEDPRVTKPYSEEQWAAINAVGQAVDQQLSANDVRLTMGGEPTFVSIDDMEGDEWQTAAVGPTKRKLSGQLIERLRHRFANGGMIHYGQGKWYPGEPLPRWALTCMWRIDGQPIWNKRKWLANPDSVGKQSIDDAQEFTQTLAENMSVDPQNITLTYEDAMYYVWKEQRLHANTNVHQADIDDEVERKRLANIFAQGLKTPIGCMLPVMCQAWNAGPRWVSGKWPVRGDQMFLIPGDSPMGLRLPLDSLPAYTTNDYRANPSAPFETTQPLPDIEQLHKQLQLNRDQPQNFSSEINEQELVHAASAEDGRAATKTKSEQKSKSSAGKLHSDPIRSASNGLPDELSAGIIRTALCIEPRQGHLYVFMPPVDRLEDYLELLAAIEETAEQLQTPVIIEGYLPPPDYRLELFKATPDPGVIEVNVQPADDWKTLVDITAGLYADARETRLGTEKFDADGTHTGTGGGNHIVLGARIPQDSPFLRRPDLLRSLIGYWHNHPSLSYLFSSRFIGPTSQAPRVDEGRRDATYEMQIAFAQIPEPDLTHGRANNPTCPPWVVDRIFRHLLVDLTGNTHRAEICIDKLFSPDSSTGRLGLVEFRGFEMPPHWQMSLTQQLLIRALIARFWQQPYRAKLINWNTSIHDRWMLPHFVHEDFSDVIGETQDFGFDLKLDWFEPHFEFRFPVIGTIEKQGVRVELRTAIEPWYVLGEEPAGGATARYVDSSVERLQVRVSGMNGDRHQITCNGRAVPLQPTGTEGEYVAGVRYRGWQPPSCLHPTIPIDEPLQFDLLDRWRERSMGGCQYFVGHPGGLNPSSFPVNAFEAESRRNARFLRFGHTGGTFVTPRVENNETFPLTLDLRRNRG